MVTKKKYSILLCVGDVNSYLVTKEALDIFSSLSGLRPNRSKSNMFITSLDEEETLSVVSNLNIKSWTNMHVYI